MRPQTYTDTTILMYLSTERKSISRTETKYILMNKLKNCYKAELENEEIPISVRAQIALRIEGVFTLTDESPDYSKSFNDIYGKRSARTIFNNLRNDKQLYRNYILSSNSLLSESATNDLVDAQTDILFLRMKTPELDDYAWAYSKSIISHRNYLRSVDINLPIENDQRKIIQSEMAMRSSYLHKIWHNSLYAMSELGVGIPNWAKILPYRPLVNAIHGTNQDDQEIGERLLSILEERYPLLHAELIASNPFHSPLIGFTVGKENNGRSTKSPSIFDIISSFESGDCINQNWENKLLGLVDYDLEEIEDDGEILDDFYRSLSSIILRRYADDMEIIGAWSMNRDKLILTLEARMKQIEEIGFHVPNISRITDWTVLIKTNYSFVKQTLDSLDSNEKKLSLGEAEVVS